MRQILGLMFALISPGMAATITVTDLFNVPGNSDVIGNKLQFDVQSIQVSTVGKALTLDIRTNYENPHLYSFVDTGVRLDPGDVFLTVNGNDAYGIPLAYHNGPAGGPWGDRLYAGHIYEIDNPSTTLLTARQALHDPQYLGYRSDEIVSMVGLGGVRDVTSGAASIQVFPIGGNNGVDGPLYDIRVNTSIPAGLFTTPGDTYGIRWSVVTGGNDVVQGGLNFDFTQISNVLTPAVPEPGTLYLMIGGALIGLRLIWRRLD